MAAGVLLLVVVGCFSLEAFAQPSCKGTKRWYQGACRYPDTIVQMQAAAEQRRREAERQRQAEERVRQDQAACDVARAADRKPGWAAYLQQHPEGACHEQARQRIGELEAEAADKPPPAPPEPSPAVVADPDPPAPADDAAEDPSIALVVAGIAVGAVGAGVGVALLVVAQGTATDREDRIAELAGPSTCAPATGPAEQCAEIEGLAEDENTYQAAGIALVAVGGAVLVATAIYGLIPREPESTEQPSSAGVQLAPWLGPATAGLGISGTF